MTEESKTKGCIVDIAAKNTTSDALRMSCSVEELGANAPEGVFARVLAGTDPKDQHREDDRYYLVSSKLTKQLQQTPIDWGFSGMGEIIYVRTYSRLVDDGHGGQRKEVWTETVIRVTNGAARILKDHLVSVGVQWDAAWANVEFDNMVTRMHAMKYSPPGRGLYAMGTDITDVRKIYAALNNCGFVCTADIWKNVRLPFQFLMDSSMLGIGPGFSLLGANTLRACTREDYDARVQEVYVVPDSREGWVESTCILIESLFEANLDMRTVEDHEEIYVPSERNKRWRFEYHELRPAGAQLKGFGGTSSGPAALQALHEAIFRLWSEHAGEVVTSLMLLDIMNHIGVCVVAGGVRRTAEIAFGMPDDEEYLEAKNFDKNPEREAYGWTSNNSVYATVGMNYTQIVSCLVDGRRGEPGLFWLQNAREYSRMRPQEHDFKDMRVAGGNPCLEQSLESYELCCLVEVMMNRHAVGADLRNQHEFEEHMQDFFGTLRAAYLYGKIVTLALPHWDKTREIMARNRRIGISTTGLQQFVGAHGLDMLKSFLNHGYTFLKSLDAHYSALWRVPESVKLTSVKPSGTVSLLSGSTPGMHWPVSRFYRRLVRFNRHTDATLLENIRARGFHTERAVVCRETLPDDMDDEAVQAALEATKTRNAANEVELSDAVGERNPEGKKQIVQYQRDTIIGEFPVDCGKGVRRACDVSMWEQLRFAEFMQREWSDNQVSCTVTYDAEQVTKEELVSALEHSQYHLKGISFMPRAHGYEQAPYIEFTEEEYLATVAKLAEKRTASLTIQDDGVGSSYCDGDGCELVKPQRSLLNSSMSGFAAV